MAWLIKYRRGLAGTLLLALVVSQIPARTFQGLLPDNVSLSGLSGTIWSGQAVRAWTMIDERSLILSAVQWRIEPWRLGWSTPLTVTSEWGDQILRGRIGLGLTGQWVLRDISLNVDTQILRALFPLYLGGTLSGRFDRIEIEDDNLVQARGVVTLRDGIWTASGGSIPLGNYRIDVMGDRASSDGVQAVMHTDNGALLLAGEANLVARAYEVSLRASGPMAKDERFRRAVSLFATPTPEGFDILVQGQL